MTTRALFGWAESSAIDASIAVVSCTGSEIVSSSEPASNAVKQGMQEKRSSSGGGFRVEQQTDTSGCGRCLLKQFKPLAAYFRIKGAKASDVSARLRKAADETISDWVGHDCEYNRGLAVAPLESRRRSSAISKNHVRRELMQFARGSVHSSGVTRCPSVIDFNIGADDPTMPPQGLIESAHTSLVFRVVLSAGNEHTNVAHSRGLLRTRRKRPRRRTAEQRDELPPPHSMTSSARATSVGGISRPSALAVLRLITRSNFTGCWTGKLAGFSPLRMRPA